jgi:hypothetical protein
VAEQVEALQPEILPESLKVFRNVVASVSIHTQRRIRVAPGWVEQHKLGMPVKTAQVA